MYAQRLLMSVPMGTVLRQKGAGLRGRGQRGGMPGNNSCGAPNQNLALSAQLIRLGIVFEESLDAAQQQHTVADAEERKHGNHHHDDGVVHVDGREQIHVACTRQHSIVRTLIQGRGTLRQGRLG